MMSVRAALLATLCVALCGGARALAWPGAGMQPSPAGHLATRQAEQPAAAIRQQAQTTSQQSQAASQQAQATAKQVQVTPPQTQAPPQQSQQTPQSKPTQTPPPAEGVPVVSLERINRLLGSESTFSVDRLPPEELRPIYRSRVEERAFKLPDFRATLDVGFTAVPPGGLNQYEINRLVTPDMYRGMALFTNSEVLRVMALALRNALLLRGLGWAVDKGMDAWDRRQVEQMREQIKKEIEAIEEENRRKAAEIKTPDPPR